VKRVRRLMAMAIIIGLFAAILFPTSTVVASWECFYDHAVPFEDLGGAEAWIWVSYNTNSDYIVIGVRAEPWTNAWSVWVHLTIDLNADHRIQANEVYRYAYNQEGPFDTWDDPVVIVYCGDGIPSGAIVTCVVGTFNNFYSLFPIYWGTQWIVP
jgi:hypothetical protein